MSGNKEFPGRDAQLDKDKGFGKQNPQQDDQKQGEGQGGQRGSSDDNPNKQQKNPNQM